MFVLDSDHLIILQQHHEPYCENLLARLEGIAESDIFLTVVTIHEQMLGVNSFISRAKDRNDMVRGYRMISPICIEANVETLYSEDPGAGEQYDTVTVVNPFA